MIVLLLVIFIAFTLLYLFFSAAIIYHLKQYLVPEEYASRIATTSFLFLSVLFWLFAAYFLYEIATVS